MEGLARGEYHLLLGAGASLGASGGDGKPLPNASDLATALLTEFGVSSDDVSVGLREAYEAVEHVRTAEGLGLEQYLCRRFSNCVPTWQVVLPKVRWRRIWTLNIDDVVEQAYEQVEKYGQRTLKTLSWGDPFSDPHLEKDEVQCVHLHGYAPDLEIPERPPIVISILEYLQASARPNSWHRIFGDSFLQEPFLIIGASLKDEYDLAECLRRGNQAQSMKGRPSFIVMQQLDQFHERQLRSWGLIPIRSDAKEFIESVLKELSKEEEKIASALPGRRHHTVPVQARIFLQQFQWYRSDSPRNSNPNHDLYQGDDPVWDDILSGRDARFEIVDAVVGSVINLTERITTENVQKVYCIWGEPGSGKSCTLLRVAKELMSKGFDVFYFRGDERLNVSAALWWVRTAGKTVLLFDGLADHSDDVGQLALECNRGGLQLMVVGAERERRLPQVVASIPPQFLFVDDSCRLGLLSDKDIDNLLAKLRQERRLGKITPLDLDAQRRYFRKGAGRRLFIGMAELEGSPGFSNRIRREYLQDVKGDQARSIYAVVSMSYALGYPLPLGVAGAATGIPARMLEQAVDSQLSTIVQKHPKGLKPRHRVIASMLVETVLTPDDRFLYSQALMKALAPYITISTIRQRTLPYLVVRRLGDQEVVFDWILRDRVRGWYESLVPEYGWDSFFWEQRALAEARLRSYAKARSFAEEAVRLQRHPFALNTLGTILVRMAVEHHRPGSEVSYKTFWDGVELLRESRDKREWTLNEHPFVTFFQWSLRFAALTYPGRVPDRELTAEWNQWMIKAKDAPVFKSPTRYQKLEQFQREWLSLAVSHTTS